MVRVDSMRARSSRAVPKGVSSSPADPHWIGPIGGWHFGSMAGRTLRGVAPLSAEQSAEKLWRGSPQGASRRGRLRLYELVEARTSGFVVRTTDPALSRERIASRASAFSRRPSSRR